MQYYKESKNIESIKNYKEERQNEIDYCLIKNSENKYIDEIHLLVEEVYDLSFIPEKNRSKIVQVNINKRLSYSDAFDYYNKNLSNVICILQNSDIYSDNSLELLNNINFDLSCVLCMNRYEINSMNKENKDMYLLNGVEYNNKIAKKTLYLDDFQPSIWTQDICITKIINIA